LSTRVREREETLSTQVRERGKITMERRRQEGGQLAGDSKDNNRKKER